MEGAVEEEGGVWSCEGELLHTSWRSTAEHNLGWQGGSMKGSACYNSTVELGIPH